MKSTCSTCFTVAVLFLVLACAGSASAGLNEGLVGYYSFDTCTAEDGSGAGNNGAFAGSNECVPGVSGNAVKFKGYYSPGYITIPNTPSMSFLDNYTFTLWFNIQNNTSMDGWGRASEYGLQALFAKAGDRSGLDLRTFKSQIDGMLYMYADSGNCCGGGIGSSIWSVDAFNLNEWHMATVTGGNGAVSLYIDCKLQGSVPTEQFAVNPQMKNMPLQLGIDQAASWYPLNGMLDEARVYNRALGADEVKALYKASRGHCPGENQAPSANAGIDQTREMTSCAGAAVVLDGSGSADPDNDPLTYTWTENGRVIASGVSPSVTLAYGTHVITLGVDDGKGATASDEVVVKVVDTTAPALTVTLSPNTLWPPNHRYVTVTPSITVSDACPRTTTVERISVSSSEPDNGQGDGDTENDIVVHDDGTLSLRAERSGTGAGRVYMVTYQATDIGGNTATASAAVMVPHSK